MFELQSVSVEKTGRPILEDVSLRFARHSQTAVVGASGGGKSTLLRLLIGLERPARGKLLFDGAPVLPSSWPQIRVRLGYVIQEGGLFPHLTAAQNVALPARHLGWPARRVTERSDELADLVRLPTSILGRYPAQLSGGQRQRVALMRALLADPEVLLLDEPLGALDPVTRYELQSELKRVFDSLRKTVVLVTHDVPEAVHLSEQLCVLDGGRLLQSGDYATLRAAPANAAVHALLNSVRELPGRGEP